MKDLVWFAAYLKLTLQPVKIIIRGYIELFEYPFLTIKESLFYEINIRSDHVLQRVWVFGS